MQFLVVCFGFPADESDLKEDLTDHRLNLLEDGFNAFAREVFPQMRRMQKKLEFITETNKELSYQLRDVTSHTDQLLSDFEEQENLVSDLLWAVGDIKTRQLPGEDNDSLTEIETTLSELKKTNMMFLEERCWSEVHCDGWSEWGTCSVDCGTGSSSRSRVCSNEGKFMSYCEPVIYETKDCTGNKCTLPALSVFHCPENYVNFQGYCLRFSDDRRSRLLSTILCEEDDAHLVEIDSPAKQAIIMQYLQTVTTALMGESNVDDDITGYSDLKTTEDQSLVAVDGIRHRQEKAYLNWKEKEMGFFEWAPGEPRNNESDGDYCLTLSIKDYRWYLRCCSKLFHYVCEAPEGGI